MKKALYDLKSTPIYFSTVNEDIVIGYYYRGYWKKFSFIINQYGLINLILLNINLILINNQYFYRRSNYLFLKRNYIEIISIVNGVISSKYKNYRFLWFIQESIKYYNVLFNECVNVDVFICKKSPAYGMSLKKIIILHESLFIKNNFYTYWIHELFHQKIGLDWKHIENEESIVEYLQLCVLSKMFPEARDKIVEFLEEGNFQNKDYLIMKEFHFRYKENINKIGLQLRKNRKL